LIFDINSKIIGVKFCFNNTNLKSIVSLIIAENLFGFNPEYMDLDYNENNYNKTDALSLVQEISDKQSALFSSISEKSDLCVTYQAVIESPLIIQYRLAKESIENSFLYVVNRLIALESFCCAYIYDFWDVKWQSATLESQYFMYNKNHSQLKRTIDRWGESIVDTSENYGREEMFKRFNLIVAPKMYFSNWFLENVINKETILKEFKGEFITNNVLYVELYSDIFETDRNKQKKFMSMINIEEIRNRFNPY